MKKVIINYGTELERVLAKTYFGNDFAFLTNYLDDGGIELSIIPPHAYEEDEEAEENDLLEKDIEHLRYLALLCHSSMKIIVKEEDKT